MGEADTKIEATNDMMVNQRSSTKPFRSGPTKKLLWLISICTLVVFPATQMYHTIILKNNNGNISGAAVSTDGLLQTRHAYSHRQGPFPMPIKGEKFEIFQPLYDMDESMKGEQLLASPEKMLATFEERVRWVSPIVVTPTTVTAKDRAKAMYLEAVKSFVSATVFNDAELSVRPRLGQSKVRTGPFQLEKRVIGDDWTLFGDTMTGWKRIDNVKNLVEDVSKNGIVGDYIETGVWRGGSSIFAKAAMSVFDEGQQSRISYVCDSFAGLPPGDKKLDNKDQGWDRTPYLEIPSEVVANNFIKYGLLDSNVVFAKGFFNETMPMLSKHIKHLSIMRLDVSEVL